MASASEGEAFDARIDARLDGPNGFPEYESWRAHEPTPTDEYLFAEARARFVARDTDVIAKPADLHVLEKPDGIELRSPALGGGVDVRGVTRIAAERVLGQIDGQRTLAEVASQSGAEPAAISRLVAACVGSVLFVPLAVAELETQLSGTELTRFVGTPYEIVRSYWENMADVRVAAARTLHEPHDYQVFSRWLRKLHVVALLGHDLTRFYRPASRIAASAVRPGALYETATERSRRPDGGSWLISGPRVGVNLLGGERYQELVCARDLGALAPERRLVDADGLGWGDVVTGRAESEREDAAWFCPPRPITRAHLEKLFSAYAEARQGTSDDDTTVPALARFHYRFVRLHPFRCANQSVAMNLVNLLLGAVRGAGMPHLLLDQFALRLTETAYVDVFERAVAQNCVPGPPRERWARLRQSKQKAYALIKRLSAAPGAEAARAAVASDPEGALAALLAREP